VEIGSANRTVDSWYAVFCQPLKERQAAAALEHNLGLVTYLPEIRRRFRGQVQQAPLFPRYLFVRANLQNVALSAINSTIGVLRLVAFDGVPLPVPVTVIKALRHQVQTLATEGGLIGHRFHLGETLRLKDGPLQGLDALFMGPMTPSERVRVLIDFLGQLREAEVNADMLERAGPAPELKRGRRTRGKGRPIKN